MKESVLESWKDNLAVPGKPDEWECKQLLTNIGVPVPKGLLLSPGKPSGKVPGPVIKGFSFPVAAKVCSSEVLHKTEKGGVRLNLFEHDLPDAVESLYNAFPGAAVLVEEMVRYRGCEIILGALYDSAFGPAVMAGAGGIFTELYNDVAFRLAPCSREDALGMLEELTIFPAMSGYRGLEADAQALAVIIEKISRLAEAFQGEECQLDINPVVWMNDTWIALDAAIVLC